MNPGVSATASQRSGGCQVGDLFHVLGGSHVLDLLYLFLSKPGPRRFVQVQEALHLSPNTLSERLQALVRVGLLTRKAFSEIPRRVEYEATPKAVEFHAVFQSLEAWAKRHTLAPIVAARQR